MLFEKRHYCHATIHETLVDLLMIQKEIHPGVFAVMDGTLVGEGPGPRCMKVQERNLMLAGADQVAMGRHQRAPDGAGSVRDSVPADGA